MKQKNLFRRYGLDKRIIIFNFELPNFEVQTWIMRKTIQIVNMNQMIYKILNPSMHVEVIAWTSKIQDRSTNKKYVPSTVIAASAWGSKNSALNDML